MKNQKKDENLAILINRLDRLIANHNYVGMSKDICQLFLIAREKTDKVAQVVAHFYVGMQLKALKNYKASIHALEIVVEIGEGVPEAHEYVNRAYNALGNVLTIVGDYYKSLTYFLKAFYLCKEHPEYNYSTYVLNNLGILFSVMADYDMALDYFIRTYSMCKQESIDYEQYIPFIVLNILETFVRMRNHEEFARWYQRHEEILLAGDEALAKAIYIIDKAQMSHDERRDQETKAYIQEFFALTKKKDDFDYLFDSYIEVADMLIEMNEEAMALQIINHAASLQLNSKMKVYAITMSRLRIRFYRQFKKVTQLADELTIYYELSNGEENNVKKVYQECLRLKIYLERTKFDQNQVLRRNEELQRSVNLDPFTEVYNKVYVEALVNEELRENQRGCSALFLLDIDLFKSVNDTYGHSIGDYVIKESVKVLRSVLRSDDIIGRVGGDEFIIFLNNIYSEELVKDKATLILKRINQIYIQEEGEDNVTVSIGVCLNKGESQSYQEMFCRADRALYEAKGNGRNQFSIDCGRCG